MVLAAGLATKLKPLSLKKPKALFPVANLTSIERVIKLIDGYGFKEAVVNLHSQGEQIEEFLGDGSQYGISLSYSWEKKIMGTAGALAKARNFFDNETFLVINSDVLTTIDLKKALDFHRNREALATLILTRADTSEYGAIGIDEEERIKSFSGKSYNLPVQGLKSEAVYTGIAFFEPSIFKYIPRGFVSLAEVIHSLLKRGQKVYGYLSDDYWLDIGTPERYTMANWDILDGRVGLEIPGTEIEKGVWIQKGAQLNTRVQFFAPVVIGAGVIIRAKVELGPYVVVGAGSFIDIECVIRKSILFNDVFVGKDTLLERCIVEDNFTINPLFEGRDTILTT